MTINPMIDFAFKFIFGSEENKDILIDFLNATLKSKQKIEDLRMLNPFNLKNYSDDKLSILDVKARLENGIYVNVEIQLVNQKDMKSRTLYYWSRMYAGQLKEGEHYYKLEKTITINIMNFVLLEETKKYHTTYHLKEDEEWFKLTDLIEIHMIEVPKIINSQRKLDDKLVEWLLFLEDPENKNMEVLQMKNPQIKKAMSVLEFISSDREARKLYEAREKDLRDRLGQIAYAREEGEYKKALETSKRMIRDGMPLDVISKYTELTIEELEKLKKEVVEDNKK